MGENQRPVCFIANGSVGFKGGLHQFNHCFFHCLKKKALEPARRKAMKGDSVLLGADLALSAPPFLSVFCLLELGGDRSFEKKCQKFLLCVKANLAQCTGTGQ